MSIRKLFKRAFVIVASNLITLLYGLLAFNALLLSGFFLLRQCDHYCAMNSNNLGPRYDAYLCYAMAVSDY